MASRPSSGKRVERRVAFGGGQHVLPEPRIDNRPAPAYKIVLFAVIPSLLFWTLLCLAIAGKLDVALLIGCFGIAAGIVGWFLRVNKR